MKRSILFSLVLVSVGLGSTGRLHGDDLFQRGDSNADGAINISDPVATLGFSFLGDDPPGCLDAADANDDGRIDTSDAVTTLNFLFGGVIGLPAPSEEGCGADPTADALDCRSFPPCATAGGRGWFWGRPERKHFGVYALDNQFGPGEGAIEQAVTIAFFDLIDLGLDLFPINLSWSFFEGPGGDANLAAAEDFFQSLFAFGVRPYLSLQLCQGGGADVPAEFRDPADPAFFRSGFDWDHPAVIARFESLLDRLVPVLLESEGFFIALGTECDVAYELIPELDPGPFAIFVDSARQYIEALVEEVDPEQEIRVGPALSDGALAGGRTDLLPLLEASSAVAWNFLCPTDGFVVGDIDDTHVAMDRLLEVSRNSSGELPVILQQMGCFSGDRDPGERSIGASPLYQAEAYDRMLSHVYQREQIRGAIGYKLMDFDPAFIDAFVRASGGAACLDAFDQLSPENQTLCSRFIESNSSIGVMWRDDGTVKPALGRIQSWLGAPAFGSLFTRLGRIEGESATDTSCSAVVTEGELGDNSRAIELHPDGAERCELRFEGVDLDETTRIVARIAGSTSGDMTVALRLDDEPSALAIASVPQAASESSYRLVIFDVPLIVGRHDLVLELEPRGTRGSVRVDWLDRGGFGD